MKIIRNEIRELQRGDYTLQDNVLINSPHSIKDITDWKYSYSIEKACFPMENLKNDKFWPTKSRVDDVYGDKNLDLKLIR